LLKLNISHGCTGQGGRIRRFQNGKVVNLATRGLFITDNTGAAVKPILLTCCPPQYIQGLALNSQRTESKAEEIIVNYNTSSAPANTPVPANVNANPVYCSHR